MSFKFLIILAILCGISIALIKKNENYFVIFIIILMFSLELILAKLIPEESPLHGRFLNMLVLLFSIFIIFRYRLNLIKNKYLLYGFFYLVILLLYIFFSASYKSINPILYIHHFRNFAFPFVFLLYFLVIKKINTRSDRFDYIFFFVAFITFQCLLALAQASSQKLSEFFYVPIYIKGSSLVLKDAIAYYGKSVTYGTFTSAATFNSVMSLVTVFLASLWFLRLYRPVKEIHALWYRISLILMIITVLMGGFRLGFGTLALGSLMILFFMKKWMAVVATTLGIVLTSWIVNTYSDLIYSVARGQVGLENPLIRLLGIFAIFDPKISSSHYLSLKRSVFLLDEMFERPFLGKPTAYLIGEYQSATDAYLALHIIDLGLVGFIILLIPYIYALKLVKRFCYKEAFYVMLIYFVLAIAQMTVDQGLFSLQKSYLYFIFSGICIYQFPRPVASNTKRVFANDIL